MVPVRVFFKVTITEPVRFDSLIIKVKLITKSNKDVLCILHFEYTEGGKKKLIISKTIK